MGHLGISICGLYRDRHALRHPHLFGEGYCEALASNDFLEFRIATWSLQEFHPQQDTGQISCLAFADTMVMFAASKYRQIVCDGGG